MNILDIKFLNRQKQEKTLREYDGKLYLIINTASKCGLTPQFDGLEAINQKYQEAGLVTIGFPCDQFNNQEFDSAEKAEEFCRINFGVTFEIMDKIDVNGPNEAPIFTELKRQQGGLLGSKIKWNFTKFIVDQDGNVVKRFAPTEKPEKIEKFLSENL
ncbi:glutathione peroxidase [Mollicutes bacterium LVI A0039]|nr:glutathione peroxidase [Mollicutes bacterium LVI A0039]